MAALAAEASPYSQTAPLEIRHARLSATSVPVYGRLDIAVDLSATFVNPFNSAEVALDCVLTAPSGRQFRIPGFFHQDFNRALTNGSERLAAAGAPGWRLRVSPVETGEHTVLITARDRSGKTEAKPLRFTATPAASPGYIRISSHDRRYFVHDNGQSYYPIGANTCWAYGRGTYDFDAWFGQYAGQGCNYGRLWLSPNWTTFALEQTGKPEQGRGMGYFDLANAWRIDHVLDLAASRGMALMLCIDSYNILRQKDGYPQWDNSAHNAANGGPLQKPVEFWTNAVMDTFYKEKLRYLVARYGYSTAVLSWEFWNEADITTGYRSDLSRAWHERMAALLRELDPYDHLITTSFAGTPGDKGVDTLPGLDYVQTHHYNSPDLAVTLAHAQVQKTAYGKPHIVGEIGADSGGPRTKDDPEGLQVHDPIWVSLATGGSGTAQPWWWDNLIHPRKLYPLFGAAVRFVANIDWPKEGFRPVTPKLEWTPRPTVLPRADIVLNTGPATWTLNEFNRPRTVRVTASGAAGELPVARIQHGLGGHRDKHNPISFETDFSAPVRFEIEVGDVSGYGGAALKVTLGGQTMISTNFADPDKNSTATLKQYTGTHTVEIPAGKHTIVVENTGQDWLMADYRFRDAKERTTPPLLAWSIAGSNTVIAWIRVEERTWDRLCNRKKPVPPVPSSTITLPDLPAGTWTVQFWNTWTGTITDQKQITIPETPNPRSPVRIQLPEILHDLALKLLRR